MRFTAEEAAILKDHARNVDEIYGDVRKGVAQSRYVFVVESGVCYNGRGELEPIPERLLGHWIMARGESLWDTNPKDCLEYGDWVRCHKVPVTTYEWQKLPPGAEV